MQIMVSIIMILVSLIGLLCLRLFDQPKSDAVNHGQQPTAGKLKKIIITPEQYILDELKRPIPNGFYGGSNTIKTWGEGICVKSLLVVDKETRKITKRAFMIFKSQPYLTGERPRAFDMTIPGQEYEFKVEGGNLINLGRPYFLEV